MRWEQSVGMVRWCRFGMWDETWDYCLKLAERKISHIGDTRFGAQFETAPTSPSRFVIRKI
jgi:hypothetical protein